MRIGCEQSVQLITSHVRHVFFFSCLLFCSTGFPHSAHARDAHLRHSMVFVSHACFVILDVKRPARFVMPHSQHLNTGSPHDESSSLAKPCTSDGDGSCPWSARAACNKTYPNGVSQNDNTNHLLLCCLQSRVNPTPQVLQNRVGGTPEGITISLLK